MNSQSFDDMHLAQHWLTTVHSQESFALSMARICHNDYPALILAEVQKSKDAQPPKSPAELDLWQRRSTVVKSRISAIAHADSMACATPQAAERILTATYDFCRRALPMNLEEFDDDLRIAADFSATISRLCAPDSP